MNTGLVESKRHFSPGEIFEKVAGLAEKAARKKGRRLKIMEVCGTHTMAFSRSGITSLLSDYLDLRSGPGCPICVTHQQDLDDMISLAGFKDVIIVTFGDLIRIPSSFSSLEKEKARGANVHMCYSPMEAVDLAFKYPEKEVVLLGIGFETTAPLMATVLSEAKKKKLKNFSLYSALKSVPPALEALFQNKDFELDAMILPGHVSAILGRGTFDFISRDYKLPAAVTGFEPLDLLIGLFYLLKKIDEKHIEVINTYSHVVKEKGNEGAREQIDFYFQQEDVLWRGLGLIANSGLMVRPDFSEFDARSRFQIEVCPGENYPDCRCGDIITGKITPYECPLFNKRCTPLSPVGPCMVSSEGACSAYYQYRTSTTAYKNDGLL